MWSKGDTVVYGSNGICRIEDIRDEQFGNEAKKYYILTPLFDEKNTYFVPSFNAALMDKMRSVFSKDDMMLLIKKMSEISPEWIDNDKLRQETYRSVLENGERERTVAVLKALYERRETLLKSGKKLRTTDEIYLNTAKRLIENEIAFIFEIEREKVQSFIEQYQ